MELCQVYCTLAAPIYTMRLTPEKYLLRYGHHKNLFTRSEVIDILIEYDSHKELHVEGFKTLHEALIWKYGTVAQAARRLKFSRMSIYNILNRPHNLKLSHLKQMQKDGINAVQLFNLNSEGEE